MDINKIRESMKVLKNECKKYKECKDCIFYDAQNESTACHLEKEPASWEEDKIVENNCTTAHRDDTDECGGPRPVLRCDDCDGAFIMLGGVSDINHIIGSFCPRCGKKIIDYKEN